MCECLGGCASGWMCGCVDVLMYVLVCGCVGVGGCGCASNTYLHNLFVK